MKFYFESRTIIQSRTRRNQTADIENISHISKSMHTRYLKSITLSHSLWEFYHTTIRILYELPMLCDRITQSVRILSHSTIRIVTTNIAIYIKSNIK